ncbi:DUF2842 domain-containing protein [Falsiroseomonas sp. CW058]|uniref:DUF2842 domain-containing protein n=1 Tax=Falsiroseomonas sp. CW058 TaxID=3388664 RepID=UPI003D31D667
MTQRARRRFAAGAWLLLPVLRRHATPGGEGAATGSGGLGAAAGPGHMGGMSRAHLALLAGLAGFLIYVAVVVAFADHVLRLHWTVQLGYFALAGVAWVWPARTLMFWGAGGRG